MANKKNDVFANIASMKVDLSDRGIVAPPMPYKPDISLPLGNSKSFPVCPKKMDTQEELEAEVVRQKAIYAPYFASYAPKMEETRAGFYLKNFRFKHEDDADWRDITIPHYDGPIGVQRTYYETTFDLTAEMKALPRVFIHFFGADYIAHVFLNGEYLGSHEGMFAPFEFDCTHCVKETGNVLSVRIENDNPMNKGGDKIYAATGPGFDEPEVGWHHCPAGMGIYQKVLVEARGQEHISDIFVRPIDDLKNCEAWVEIFNSELDDKDLKVELSVYGENFEEVVFENMEYIPSTSREIGVGDSFGEAVNRRKGLLDKPVPMPIKRGVNFLKIPFQIENARLWDLDTPWLYRINIKIFDGDRLCDTQTQHFGVRSFKMDTVEIPRGNFYLNNRKIRLRGTNTMGHEQLDVMAEDFEQLEKDILLAKIANMNFFRLTQRPVQPEIYDYCDRLGIMVQTDLPTFGVIRINKYCECIKQCEDMERLVRSHPCCIMDSYINEPFPNAENAPHRHITRKQMNDMFDCADVVVKMANPDRVTKHVDGDYDPPNKTLPDNHCYTMWYNGNGLDIGSLAKGNWMPIKPDWNFGCGEFGAEGIDTPEVMMDLYPKHWLPQEGEVWGPEKVTMAQTEKFHRFFFETPKSFEEWSKVSRDYQAWAVKMQTEAYRRNPRMVTFAIHLFIDAFPSNWMKTIMDVRRIAKPAYFTYKNALEPVMVSLHTDNYKYFCGKEVSFETWVCNDTHDKLEGSVLKYQVMGTDISGETPAIIETVMPVCQGFFKFTAPTVAERTMYTVRVALVDAKGEVVDYKDQEIEVLPCIDASATKVKVYGEKAFNLAQQMKFTICDCADQMIISDYQVFEEHKDEITEKINNGGRAVMLELGAGDYDFFGNAVHTQFSSMLPLNFTSRDTGHNAVRGFGPHDFRFWYKKSEDKTMPIVNFTFDNFDFTPILLSGNTSKSEEWVTVLSCGEIKVGKGTFVLCQLELDDRVEDNPIAKQFVQQLMEK